MSKLRYQDIAVLVADDFSSFRSTVNSMLMNLGVLEVDTASTGEEVIEKCELKSYDVILCDYDLGEGRNGQHVLEELRYREFLAPTSIFIIVSAESSRNIVMSAYDCEPDDYLMKPITAMMLEQRMARLLKQKYVLKPVFNALDRGDTPTAIDMLVELSLAEDRNSVAAQKLLGKVFLENDELAKAEKLYKRALETRAVDWARLGLAKVKHLQGELRVAGDWLDKIVEENPLYLPAYDVLADNWEKKGEKDTAQDTVERAVDVSPMSILRQKRLAKIANENEDPTTAVEALRKAIKLGKFSCHGTPLDSFELARTVTSALEKNLDIPPGAIAEAIEALDAAKDEFVLDEAEWVQMDLLRGRIHACEGKVGLAREHLRKAQESVEHEETGIDVDVDRVTLLLSLGQTEEAEAFLDHLKKKYADDQKALQRLDPFLTEPASDSNRALVASVNREGIDLYSLGEYDRALECFEKARKLFPKHLGIQLNIVQSLIGKMKENPEDDALRRQCHESLVLVESLVDKDHSQYERFARLKRRADVFLR
ncbi:MAG: response regulator [Agarilytica sp.]